MDFALTDVQQMLEDSAAKFVQNEYDFETRRKLEQSELGYSQENWNLFADLGWLAMPFAEAYGGMDGDLTDLMVLQEQLGRGLILEPLLPTMVLGGGLIKRHGHEAQKAELLEKLISGELKIAFGGFEAQAQNDITQIQTKAEKKAGDFVLNGKKAVVLAAPSADLLIVAARTSGNAGDKNGLSLFLVEPDQSGVSMHSYPTNDGYRAADITLNNVQVSAGNLLGEADDAFAAIQQTMNDAVVAISAEAIGVMEKLLAATVEYTKVRKQFDVPIATFQVLQHRMVDMFMECQQARSMLYFGALAVAKGGEEANRAASMLKVKIGSAGRLVGQHAVQTHGGMGVTEELDVGHFFKRITMINTLFGTHDEHLQQLVSQMQNA